jgi:hypothetical protein
VQAVRDDMSWALTEPQPNRYDWAHADALVRTTTEAGFVLLPVIDDAPQWAAPTGASLPSNPQPYGAFVAAVVARYGVGGSFWRANPRLYPRPLVWFELWNEPYYADHNRDPGVYVKLVRAAVTAGRRADPSARFLIEGAASYPTSGGGSGDWIAGMYEAMPDLGSYFDAMAVHPYGGKPAVDSDAGNTEDPVDLVEDAHRDLVARGDGDKPIWVTEIGWPTCSGGDNCVNDAQQASYLRTFLNLAATTWRSYVRAVFIYGLRDLAPAPLNDPYAWYGLLRPDLTRKPAWQVLRDATRGTP